MKRFIALGGASGTGKTTLVNALLETINPTSQYPFQYGLVRGVICPKAKVAVLLDTRGVNVADVKRFVRNARTSIFDLEGFTLIIEGQKYFTKSFLEYCARRAPVQPIMLTAEQSTLMGRAIQSGGIGCVNLATPLQGRTTDAHLILEAMPHTRIFHNNTLTEQREIMAFIHAVLLLDAVQQPAVAVK